LDDLAACFSVVVVAMKVKAESIGGQLEAARRGLEEARQELAAARARVQARAGAGADDTELQRLLTQRDEAEWRVEARQERVSALEGRQRDEQAAAVRAEHLAVQRERLERLTGWKERYSATCAEADRQMVALAEMLERRQMIAQEIMAVAPARLRDVAKVLENVWLTRAALTAGLWQHFSAQHVWGDQRQPLAADAGWLAACGVDSLIAELEAELAEPVEQDEAA
jgi:DNA repair exonuclease SbcCD ATPase subunit